MTGLDGNVQNGRMARKEQECNQEETKQGGHERVGMATGGGNSTLVDWEEGHAHRTRRQPKRKRERLKTTGIERFEPEAGYPGLVFLSLTLY